MKDLGARSGPAQIDDTNPVEGCLLPEHRAGAEESARDRQLPQLM